MSTPRNPKNFILIQTVVLIIAGALTILSIIDLATGGNSFSLWIGVICWPIVVLTSVYQIVQVRRLQ